MVEQSSAETHGAEQRICLHVGCGPRNAVGLHPRFQGADWREVRVDIDPQVEPDIVASITDLHMIATGSVDAIWSSHNLEHLFSHEVRLALDEFYRVLKTQGILLITLPDLQKVAELVAADQLEDVAYVSPMGPITPLDIVYGHRPSLSAGKHFMAHRTGFTARTLRESLARSGFESIYLERAGLDLWAQAEKPQKPPRPAEVPDIQDSRLRLAADRLAQGIERHSLGQLAEAEQIYRLVLQAEPANPDALHLLGVIAFQRGDAQSAVASILQAIAINPQSEVFYTNLGAIYQETGRYDEALAVYRRALELKPNLAETHNNVGNVFAARKEPEQALECYRHALALRPDLFEALNNVGTVCRDLGRLDEAAGAYTQALQLRPKSAAVHDGLGWVARQQQRFDDAAAAFQQAVALDPTSARSWGNLGCALHDLGRLDEALEKYNRAIDLDSQNAAAHFNRALLWLLRGQWNEGWQEFEWRWKRPGMTPPRVYDRPVWDGAPLAGKTMLVSAEQGLGDTLQFIRYCPLLRQRGVRVAFEAPSELMRLLAGWPGADLLIEEGAELPPFDLQVRLLSLPRLFATTLESIPEEVPYLTARQELLDHWRRHFGAAREFRVGIAWQGNPLHDRDRLRSLPLDLFLPLGELPGVRLYSLQTGEASRQLDELADTGIENLADRLDDFEDAAAAIQCLDLVITCDTAVAHLAGALGAPVWVAVAYLPDWRWQLDREDSPWYPTLRLFRQREPGDWQEVFQRLEKELRERVAARAADRHAPIVDR